MPLPEELQEAIAEEAARFNLQDISCAREELTGRYRQAQPRKRAPISNDMERCAYVVARMPATYAVICRVLKELQTSMREGELNSLLDLGAGPGTAMWGATHVFPAIEEISLIEQDASLAALGKRLVARSSSQCIKKAHWQLQSMLDLKGVLPHDLVILSYSAGELPPNMIGPLIGECWKLTKRFLVVIEPGTPVGFELIRLIRHQLIGMEAHLVAPCPHAAACPMHDGNWCHFSERIERSFLHCRIKKGTLGYEDEKYSYIIASKGPWLSPQARVLRHPQKHSGHVTFELCTKDGLKQQVVSKRTPEAYKQARKLEWGDTMV